MTDLPPFDVTLKRAGEGEEAMITVSGDIDIASVARLEAVRQEALASDPPAILIDLSGVHFIDSSGLKFLIDTYAQAKQDGWTLRLKRPAETAMRAFTVTGADRHLPFMDDGQD
jgi:anti-sigma B factor antagonist